MTVKARLQEISEELRTVLTGRGNLIDSILPPIVFLILNAWLGFNPALIGAFSIAGIISLVRIIRHQPLRYALGGIGAVIVAGAVAKIIGSAEGFFLPGIITGILTVVICFVSVIFKRPMVAFTSYVVRRWPLRWYWHPLVRPAYSEVTIAWGIFFGLRTFYQFELFKAQAVSSLGVFQVISGWPATILLLILTYLYGVWRLRNLHGPSVQEYIQETEPPWQSQRRGF